MDPNDRVVTDAQDRSVANAHNKSTLANVIGWLALIIAIIALVLAWMAYDSVSEDNLSEMIQEEIRGTTQMEQPAPDATNESLNDGTVNPGTDTGNGGGTMNDNDTPTSDDATTVPEGDTTTPQQQSSLLKLK